MAYGCSGKGKGRGGRDRRPDDDGGPPTVPKTEPSLAGDLGHRTNNWSSHLEHIRDDKQDPRMDGFGGGHNDPPGENDAQLFVGRHGGASGPNSSIRTQAGENGNPAGRSDKLSLDDKYYYPPPGPYVGQVSIPDGAGTWTHFWLCWHCLKDKTDGHKVNSMSCHRACGHCQQKSHQRKACPRLWLSALFWTMRYGTVPKEISHFQPSKEEAWILVSRGHAFFRNMVSTAPYNKRPAEAESDWRNKAKRLNNELEMESGNQPQLVPPAAEGRGRLSNQVDKDTQVMKAKASTIRGLEETVEKQAVTITDLGETIKMHIDTIRGLTNYRAAGQHYQWPRTNCQAAGRIDPTLENGVLKTFPER